MPLSPRVNPATGQGYVDQWGNPQSIQAVTIEAAFNPITILPHPTIPGAVIVRVTDFEPPAEETAPTITTDPSAQTVQDGGTPTFSAAGTGEPTPTITWQVNTGSGWVDVPPQPSVTTNPASASITAGGNATFTAAATNATSVQWQINTGSGWSNIVGANTSSFSVNGADISMNGAQYRAKFVNSAGTTFTSAALLTVNSGSGGTVPVITVNPSSSSISDGQTVTLTAAATGSPTPVVQWQSRPNSGGTWADIAGATSTSYTTPTLTGSQTGIQYRAGFTNAAGGPVYTSIATITVNTTAFAPTIDVQPWDYTIVSNGTSQTFSINVSGSPAPAIQWQKMSFDANYNAVSWANIAGQTGSSLVIAARTASPTNDTSWEAYRAIATNNIANTASRFAYLFWGSSSGSDFALTSPRTPYASGLVGSTISIRNPALNTKPSGADPTFQWQESSDGSNFANIAGATNRTLTLTNVQTTKDGYYYRALANAAGAVSTDFPTKISVTSATAAPTFTVSPIVAMDGDTFVLVQFSALVSVPAPLSFEFYVRLGTSGTWIQQFGYPYGVVNNKVSYGVRALQAASQRQMRVVVTNAIGSTEQIVTYTPDPQP